MHMASDSPKANGRFFFSSRRRHTRSLCDWSSDVCSSDLGGPGYGNGGSGARGIRGAVAAEQPKKSAPATGGATTGVDILDKPNPVYSAEGRTLRIEGDVVLEVVFLASSQVQVIRVVSGLSHGLD